MNINTPVDKVLLDEEVKWDKSKMIISRTDVHGTIVYMNDTFEEVSEYNKIELLGEPHNIIRHPDMPKVIFKKLWESLKKGENYHAIVKNLSRTGRYYWVITDFIIERDEEGKITGYTGRRRSIPQVVEDKIAFLYATLLEIEKVKGEKASELYFHAYLDEEAKMSYEEFVIDLMKKDLPNQKSEGKKQAETKSTEKNEEKPLEERVKSGFIRSLFFSVYN